MPRVNIGISDREKTIREEIKATTDKNYLNLKECAAYMGVCVNTAKAVLEGVKYQRFGRIRKYLIADLAHALAEREESA